MQNFPCDVKALLILLCMVLPLLGCRNQDQNQQINSTMTTLNKLDHPAVLQVLFHPRKAPHTPPPKGAIDIDFTVAEDISIGCRLYEAGKDKPLLLYFHGNGEIVPDYDDIGAMYSDRGMNLLITDYRGYGWSSGSPTATALLEDAVTIYNKTRQWMEDNQYTGPVFVMGRSLGSACAIEIASNHNDGIKGLIIESGFAETLPLAATLGLDGLSLGMAEEDCFNNHTKIVKVTKPTFILHGQLDTLIPIVHARKLHAECGARSKELQIIPGADHNSLIAVGGHYYFDAIKTFVERVSGISDWRARRKKFKEQSQ